MLLWCLPCCQARSKAQGSGPCPVGVRGFKSHPPHSTWTIILRWFISSESRCPHESMFSEKYRGKPEDGRDRNLEPTPCILASERIYQRLILAFVLARQSHALVLDCEAGRCDSYVDRCHRRVSINRYDGRIGNHGVGFCQGPVRRDSDRTPANIPIKVQLHRPYKVTTAAPYHNYTTVP